MVCLNEESNLGLLHSGDYHTTRPSRRLSAMTVIPLCPHMMIDESVIGNKMQQWVSTNRKDRALNVPIVYMKQVSL